MNIENPMIATIDGPAGSGKGAVGQLLAIRLGWHFLDSGALYRTCAYVMVRNSLSVDEIDAILQHMKSIQFRSIPVASGEDARVLLNGTDISDQVRTTECGRIASQLAVSSTLRQYLLAIQREYYAPPGLVADGRDMGSVVFPDARVKFYLNASLEVRAKRKHKQLKDKGICANFDILYQEIKSRDERDASRFHAPLAIPDGALTIDTSSIKIDEVVDCILRKINAMTATAD